MIISLNAIENDQITRKVAWTANGRRVGAGVKKRGGGRHKLFLGMVLRLGESS